SFLLCTVRAAPPAPRLPSTTLFRSPNCPVCGENPTVTELIDYEQFCGMPGHDRSAYHTDNESIAPAITVEELHEKLARHEDFILLDVREPHEWQISRSEEHTSELQSRENLVCRLLLEKKKTD